MKKQGSGFTLFELLVSISIIGILVALVAVSFGAAQKKGRDARRTEDMKAVQTAAEQYYSLSSYNYPASTGVWVLSSGTTILSLFPSDPKGVGWTAYSATTNSASAYCFCAAVENSNTGNSTSNACAFASSGSFFCVRNQQ